MDTSDGSQRSDPGKANPLTAVLHPSPWRLRLLGLFGAVGHPLFAWVWSEWVPQPYENWALRLPMSLLGLLLVLPPIANDPWSRRSGWVFSIVFWVQLPLFFSWMYLCNGGNTVWLASLCAMLLIYYHVTDWRLATLGTVGGGLIAWLCFAALQPTTPQWSDETLTVNTLVIGFAWASAALLGLSSANLRREHLRQTLATMGIMAHELRTPLATLALMGDALQRADQQAGADSPYPAGLGRRIDTLVRHMHYQIDTQISNARLMALPQTQEPLQAAELVHQVVEDYPYRHARERAVVQVSVRQDFRFMGSRPLFVQVLYNLIKNALRALSSRADPPAPGDLQLIVEQHGGNGVLVVADRGIGMDETVRKRIFEPFFSTHSGAGHGLGLAFCRRVLTESRGQIRVESAPGAGARFILELPALPAVTSPS